MPPKSNNLEQFWQELKRRKVIRRNMVYAASGFVLLELVSIIAEPFGLPDWTLKFVFIVLFVGFVISIVLSWFYDYTPDGLERIKSARQAKDVPPEKPNRLIAWKIATYISVAVIVGFLVFNILGGSKQAEDLTQLEKSIAVLPFKYISDEADKQYLADGAMDDILLHLSKIEDLRVMSRTSVEQYRGTDKTATAICQELDVAFLLEGSFQKYGDQVRLIVQLITPGKEGHVWANEYNRNWKDIFSVQSEVAQNIAGELHAVITPEEIQLIEKKPTTSLTAYDFYQRGREEYTKYLLDNENREALERAEDLYHDALEYDSAFAQAYTGLAWVYHDKYYYETLLTENFMDSMLILADIAISFDDQSAEAYVIRGTYYRLHYKNEQAINEYDKAIKFNPNNWMVYNEKGRLYYHDDYVKSIDNYQKAASLHRGPNLPVIYRTLGIAYAHAGFKEKSIYYVKEAFKLDDDSARYYRNLAEIEDCNGNFKQAIEYGEKSFDIDSTFSLNFLVLDHMYLDLFEESLEYCERLKTLDRPNPWVIIRISYVYWVNGFKEEADYYFNIGLESYNEMLKLGRSNQDLHTVYGLASMHAFLGDKDKAYEYLRLFNQRPRMPLYMIKEINNNPLFDSIRDESEFQQIVGDVEAKYQAEHERVRKWLEENEML